MSTIDSIYSDDCAAELFGSALRLLKEFGLERYLLSGRIVDMGGGTGEMLHIIKRNAPCVDAVCVDRNPVKKYKDICYIKREITDSGMAAESVDAVLLVNIVDYFGCGGINPGKLFGEVDRILVKGGLFLPLDFGRDKIQPFISGYRNFGNFYFKKPDFLDVLVEF